MSSPEFQLSYGVKSEDVLNILRAKGIFIDTEEVNLVDEGVFEGMYNGSGDCPEWLGIGLSYLDESDGFITVSTMTYQDKPNRQAVHKEKFDICVNKFKDWLHSEGYEIENLDIPQPEYFIVCGTD